MDRFLPGHHAAHRTFVLQVWILSESDWPGEQALSNNRAQGAVAGGYAFTLAALPASARTYVLLLSIAGSVDWRAAATGDPAYLSKWQQLR
jgi:hypothetical protein